MTPEQANNERDALRSQVRFHRVLNFSLVLTIFLGVVLFGWVLVRDVTKIVPPVVNQPYEIGSNYSNKEYLLDMAHYVLNTVLTVTPQTVDYNNKIILKMTHPDGYPDLKTALDAASKRLRKEKVTTIWVPRKESVDIKAKQVIVSGILKTFISDKLTSERDKDYVVDFTITTSGRLYVSNIEEVVKRSSDTAMR